jgi:hypothetical protein
MWTCVKPQPMKNAIAEPRIASVLGTLTALHT